MEKQEFIDIGPKTWQHAMNILRVVITDGEREGRINTLEHLDKMAALADKLPEAIAIIQECRKLTPNVGTFSGEITEENKDGFKYSDPLTLRIEEFLKSLKKA